MNSYKGKTAYISGGSSSGSAVAVALGLVAACATAVRLGRIGAGERERVEAVLSRFGLPTRVALDDGIFDQVDEVVVRIADRTRDVELWNAPVPFEHAAEGAVMDLFGEGEGMVGTGRYVDGVFEASEILARHDPRRAEALEVAFLLRPARDGGHLVAQMPEDRRRDGADAARRAGATE